MSKKAKLAQKSIELVKKHNKKLGFIFPDEKYDNELEALTEQVVAGNIVLDATKYAVVNLDNAYNPKLANYLKDLIIDTEAGVEMFNENKPKNVNRVIVPDIDLAVKVDHATFVKMNEKPSKEFMETLILEHLDGKHIGLVNENTFNQQVPYSKGASRQLDLGSVVQDVMVNVGNYVVEHVTEEDGREISLKTLDVQSLLKGVSLAARASLRTTFINPPTAESKRFIERDRPVSLIVSGLPYIEKELNYTEQQMNGLMSTIKEVAHDEILGYAIATRVAVPLVVVNASFCEEASIEVQIEKYTQLCKFLVDHNPNALFLIEDDHDKFIHSFLDNWDYISTAKFMTVGHTYK